jgi:hypothetical protein
VKCPKYGEGVGYNVTGIRVGEHTSALKSVNSNPRQSNSIMACCVGGEE